jgi:expansin (peptidoglycan-binding protein)
MKTASGALLLLNLFWLSLVYSVPLDLYRTVQTGEATYYSQGAANSGHCTLDAPFWPGVTVTTVAIASATYGASVVCGMCIQINGTGTGSGSNPVSRAPFLTYVTDECPTCTRGSDIDIATGLDGRWGITWTAVECPVGSTNLQFVHQGSNEYYLKLQVRNGRME